MSGLYSSLYPGPETDGVHSGSTEPVGERHQTDAQSVFYGHAAAERGEHTQEHEH